MIHLGFWLFEDNCRSIVCSYHAFIKATNFNEFATLTPNVLPFSFFVLYIFSQMLWHPHRRINPSVDEQSLGLV